jgi:hypothetical protein
VVKKLGEQLGERLALLSTRGKLRDGIKLFFGDVDDGFYYSS